jgi:hypothetical protein
VRYENKEVVQPNKAMTPKTTLFKESCSRGGGYYIGKE